MILSTIGTPDRTRGVRIGAFQEALLDALGSKTRGEKGDDGWMFTFASMTNVINYNHRNQWFFRTPNHTFMFAFTDVVFDENGFPHIKGGE